MADFVGATVPAGNNRMFGVRSKREYPRDFLFYRRSAYGNKAKVKEAIARWNTTKAKGMGGSGETGEGSGCEPLECSEQDTEEIIRDCRYLWDMATAHVAGAIQKIVTQRATDVGLKRPDTQPCSSVTDVNRSIQELAKGDPSLAANKFKEVWYDGFPMGCTRNAWTDPWEKEWLEQMNWTYPDGTSSVTSSYQRRLSCKLNELRQHARKALNERCGINVKERQENRASSLARGVQHLGAGCVGVGPVEKNSAVTFDTSSMVTITKVRSDMNGRRCGCFFGITHMFSLFPFVKRRSWISTEILRGL